MSQSTGHLTVLSRWYYTTEQSNPLLLNPANEHGSQWDLNQHNIKFMKNDILANLKIYNQVCIKAK